MLINNIFIMKKIPEASFINEYKNIVPAKRYEFFSRIYTIHLSNDILNNLLGSISFYNAKFPQLPNNLFDDNYSKQIRFDFQYCKIKNIDMAVVDVFIRVFDATYPPDYCQFKFKITKDDCCELLNHIVGIFM